MPRCMGLLRLQKRSLIGLQDSHHAVVRATVACGVLKLGGSRILPHHGLVRDVTQHLCAANVCQTT